VGWNGLSLRSRDAPLEARDKLKRTPTTPGWAAEETRKEEENDNAEALRTLRFAERKRDDASLRAYVRARWGVACCALPGRRGAIRGRVLEFCWL
jgi:hypothetical protein